MSKLIEVTDQNFEEKVLSNEIPVVVFFSTPWASPCGIVRRTLESLVSKYEEKCLFMEMNIDDNRNTFDKYSIRAVPSIIFFKSGSKEGTLDGTPNQNKIEAEIAKLL